MIRDHEIAQLIQHEDRRQRSGLELIASENYVSEQVMEAAGSILTNKYAEGLPGKRYYGGCEWVDRLEQLAIDRLCTLFGAAWANVQPHSGAQANAAVMLAVLQPGDAILGFDLSHGLARIAKAIEHQVGAALGQFQGNSQANPTGGTGDQSGFAVKKTI